MSGFEGLEHRSAADVGRAIACGLDPVEVTEFFLERIAACPDQSIFLHVAADRARPVFTRLGRWGNRLTGGVLVAAAAGLALSRK